MCHGPYDPQHLMRDMARRTQGVHAPGWSISPLLARLARWINAARGWRPDAGRPEPQGALAPIRRDQR